MAVITGCVIDHDDFKINVIAMQMQAGQAGLGEVKMIMYGDDDADFGMIASKVGLAQVGDFRCAGEIQFRPWPRLF